ncbi:DTW domain-containing protein [Gammaproteobacteria bacterium]|nr:DTW domain-containing protein [Gammaproteobacteria bacterium]
MARLSCEKCKRPKTVCYCHLIKVVENHWPVYIVQHFEESRHAIGTAKIAELSLKSCKTHVLEEEQIFKALNEHDQSNNDIVPTLIYPGESSVSLKQLRRAGQGKLIFIDGSWRKSRKIFYESAYLQSLPRYGFSLETKSRYKIRKEPKEGYCSTLEAIIYMLATLENDANKYSNLLEIMDWMIERQLEFIGNETFNKNYR